MCELDAAFFHIYGIATEDIAYIMETFSIVKRKDEQKYGDFRTKLQILDIYDRMKLAIDTGGQYQTLLDPPPADPRVSHPNNPPEWLKYYTRPSDSAAPSAATTTGQPSTRRARAASAPTPQLALDFGPATIEPRSAPMAPKAAAVPPTPTRPPADELLAQALDYLKTHPGPRSRAEITTALGLADPQWLSISRQLADHASVEKTGEKRGTRYAWKAP
jgi:hypothetical protein